MPFRIKKVKGGYKVILLSDPTRVFSKNPQTKDKAEAHIRAIYNYKGGSSASPQTSFGELQGGAGEGKTGMFGLSDYVKSPNFKNLSFQNQLLALKIPPDDYLQTAKHLATKYKYNPDGVSFATDGKHKLVYTCDKGVFKFGAVGYGDMLIWSFLEKRGLAEKGLAEKKRQIFVKSHKAMVKDYGVTDLSPNTLAIRILWDHI